jgi:YfiH family protein
VKPLHPDWIVPDWPAPPSVKAFITTRAGGISKGAFGSFNLGMRAGDDPQAVAANRDLLREMLPAEPKWLRQVHGSRVVDADKITNVPEADAAVARKPGTVCAIMIADCIPVLLTDRAGTMVAAAHAGWRGLSSGVLEKTIARMKLPPEQLLAYLGPGIGPRAFEVGADVRDAFLAHDARSEWAFAPHSPGKWLADLFELARRRLMAAGLAGVHGGGLCTYTDARRFYSYRRDRVTGRMAALIWLDA